MFTLRTCALALILALSPGVLRAQAVDADLRAAEQSLAAALVAKDEQAFARLLATDFFLRGTPNVDRATWIANALKLCWGDRVEITDFRVVQPAADSAIVTLVMTTNRDPATCEPAIVSSLITDIWRREPGGWRLGLRHSGPAGTGVDTQFAKTDPPPPLFEGSTELSLVSSAGNSEISSLGFGGTLTWRPNPWKTDARVSFLRSETREVETARVFVASVRQARTLTARVDAFGRFEFLVDEFAGIDNRWTLDAGLGLTAVDNERHRLRFDAGVGYAHESRLTGADLDGALTNVAATYRWQFRQNAALDNLSLFTLSLDRAEDWRFRNSLALSAAMTRVFSLKVAHEVKYVNAPVEGFKKTDRILSAAIVAKFGS
jgi:putative salt-induced outer membrane protein YdiY